MSKRTTVPWYIVAWGVWAIASVMYIAAARSRGGANLVAMTAESIVAAVAAIVMLVMWIGAVANLAMQWAWAWFLAVFVLHLIGLGIIGMIGYGVAGPGDTKEPVVTRPRPRPAG